MPIIVGNTAKEEAVFGSDLQAARIGIATSFGKNAVRAFKFYGLNEGGTPLADQRLGDVPMQAATDILYRCVTVAISRSTARAGLPVWQYQYDYGTNVFHSAEQGVLFELEPKIEAKQAPLAAYWANFARSGDPNGPGLPHWPRYRTNDQGYLEFGQAGPVALAKLRQPLCGWMSG